MKPFFTLDDCDVLKSITQVALGHHPPPAISLDKANRLLEERGKVVYGNVEFDFWNEEQRDPKDDQWQYTHQALLINISPIEQDSVESLVEELLELLEFSRQVNCGVILAAGGDWLKRAKALLEKK